MDPSDTKTPDQKPVDNTALLAELDAAKKEAEGYKTKIAEMEEAAKGSEGTSARLEKYTAAFTDRFNKAYEEQPDYIKKHINAEDYASDPLAGLDTLNKLKAFSAEIAEAQSKDDHSKPPSHGVSKPDSSKSLIDHLLGRHKN